MPFGSAGKSISIQVSLSTAVSTPLRVWNRASASIVRCWSSHNTCADASVAWPHRSTSISGVNQRRS